MKFVQKWSLVYVNLFLHCEDRILLERVPALNSSSFFCQYKPVIVSVINCYDAFIFDQIIHKKLSFLCTIFKFCPKNTNVKQRRDMFN